MSLQRPDLRSSTIYQLMSICPTPLSVIEMFLRSINKKQHDTKNRARQTDHLEVVLLDLVKGSRVALENDALWILALLDGINNQLEYHLLKITPSRVTGDVRSILFCHLQS